MKKIKIMYGGLLALALLLTGCGGETSGSSEDSGSSSAETSLKTPEKFAAAGFTSAINGWPSIRIKALLNAEGVDDEWISEYIPALPILLTAQVYGQNYQEELDLVMFKTFQFAYPSKDETNLTTYVSMIDETKWDIEFDEEVGTYSLKTRDGDNRVSVGLVFIEETEELPAATYFSFTVREKEEFPGAAKPPEGSIRRAIAFSNTYRITQRSKEEVVWAAFPISFSVQKALSATSVGNIPNNNGAGYLSDPLRVYKDQKLIVETPDDYRIAQVIIRLRDFVVESETTISLDAFPLYNDVNIKTFTTSTSLLYQFESEVSLFDFTLSADARMTDVIIIYTPLD